ncbi:MAG: Nuclease [Chlamydiae bacterium]|nr:Nuclease [Chlamydiota bacterium]
MRGLGFSVGLVVGAASIFSYQMMERSNRPTALPILEREGFSLAYDTRGKIPFWTHEHLTSESLVKVADRKGVEFREDPDLYGPHRSSLGDYAKSGFDRGHLVPAADLRFSEEALKESFYLSNISPQHPDCNRGLWAELERSTRQLVKVEGPLEVVTGPLFIPHEGKDGKRYVTYQVIGKNDVAVPTHFFKVIKSATKCWVYVIPNASVSGDLESYKFSLEKLEQISGIRFDNPSAS